MLDISWSAIFKIFIMVVITYTLFVIKDILIWFIFALMIGTLFNFLIDGLEKKKIPRLVSAFVLYFGCFALIGFFIFKTAPVLIEESKDFAQNFPVYLKKISPIFEKMGVRTFRTVDSLSSALQAQLEPAGKSFLGALFGLFGGASATLFVIIMAFFISVEKRFVERSIEVFFPENKKDYIFNLWGRAKKKVSGWFITRVVGVIFVMAASFLVLKILNVKYSLLLAIVVGLLDFLPIVGPILGAVLLFMLVGMNSWLQAIFVLIAFVIIQQLENNLIFPILFKRLMGISPVLVLIALAVGGKLWGAAGAILGIPMAAVLYEILKDYLKKAKKEPNKINAPDSLS